MDSIGQYLIPESLISSIILYVLLALSIVWAVIFFRWMRSLNVWRREVEGGQEVGDLTSFLESLGGGNIPPPEQAVRAAEAFGAFSTLAGFREQSPVAHHVRALFDSGWKGSRLDVEGLIRHTSSRMFKAQALLRAVLAVFIIIGLLGTLFGLAASLSQMSVMADIGGALTADTAQRGLRAMLFSLKSAFAPSIWGIISTLLFMLVLSFYAHFKAQPLRSALESATLTVWVPKLMPSTSTRFLEGLNRSEDHVRRNAETVSQMATFSRSIEEQSRLFKEHLQDANQPLKALAASAAGLNTFAGKFAASAQSLTSFQTDLKTLYEQMKGESEAFHRSVKQGVKDSATFQQEVKHALTSQTEQIRALMLTMKSYEQSYIKERGQTDARLQEVLAEAKKAYSGMVGKHRELIKELGDPLRSDLRAGLDAVGQTLRDELRGVQQKFGDLGAPLTRAAGGVEKSLGAAQKQTEAVGGGLADLNRNVAALGQSVAALGQQVSSNGHGSKGGGGEQAQGAAGTPDLSLFQIALLLVHVSEENASLAREVQSLRAELGARKV